MSEAGIAPSDGGVDARRDAWLLAAILLLATAMRLINLDAEYWFDEIVTVRDYVRLPVSQIVTVYTTPNNHLLNTLLAHACRAVGGEAPWVIRLPAVAFGIAGVWAFYYLAVVFFSRRMALLGAALMAVSYPHIYYSQNARGYSALIFLAMLSMGLLLRLLREADRRRRLRLGAAFALAAGVGVYAQLLMAFVAAGQAAVLALARRWRTFTWLCLGGLVTMLLYSPMALALYRVYTAPRSEAPPAPAAAVLWQQLRPVWPLIPVAALLGPLLAWRMARRMPLATMLVLAPLAAMVPLLVFRAEGLSPRMFLYALPVAYLFLLELLDALAGWWRHAPAAGAAVVGVASLVLLVPYYQLPKQGFQQALSYVRTHESPGDERLGLSLAGKACRFYDPTLPLVDGADDLTAWLAGPHRRTWVIYTFEPDLRLHYPELEKWVQQSTVPQVTFPGAVQYGEVHVNLWEPTRAKEAGK
jgi:mannosyltransferase